MQKINNYEINLGTLLIEPVNENISHVIEINKDYMVNKKTLELIDDSCKYFGSSYMGRVEGTKNLVKLNYKAPIIIEESKNIIFFPISSARYNNTTWISLNNIEDYYEETNSTTIVFKGGEHKKLDISYRSLENQILRSTMLLSTFQKRKLEIG